MSDPKRLPSLFDAYGFTIDLAAVDGNSQLPLPVPKAVRAAVLKDLEVIPGPAAHGISIRNTKVMRRPLKWARKLHSIGTATSTDLEAAGVQLMPGGALPFYDPKKHASIGGALGPEAHALLEKVIGGAQHGWSNSQGLHLEIHFGKPSDFGKLHAAVRLLLPLIPGLAAASPILEGKSTGSASSRLQSHLHAFQQIPELIGYFVPEAVFDPEAHDREVLAPIAQALAPRDPKRLLDPQALDARAATVNFERDTLTIHAIDGQESPTANMAVAEMIIAVLRALVRGRWVSNYLQRAWGTEDLQQLMLTCIQDGSRATIANRDYLLMFGVMKQESMTASQLWQQLFVELYGDLSEQARGHIGHILEHGTLAERILARTGPRTGIEKVRSAYSHLAACHAANEAYR